MKQIIYHLLFLSILYTSALAQQSVEGTVTDINGDPIVGVNVIEQGTTNGTSTDINGEYQLNVSGSNSVLLFSFLGFETVEEEVGERSVIDVVLRDDTQLLDDVVVSALGFEQNRDEMGSTSSVISPRDITRSGETTLLNSLGAKASNVTINRSNGDPGAGSTIRIRGANTIGGSGSPLIIVDGVPLNNSTTYGGGNNVTGGRTGGTSQQSRINDINPDDIESVQILKGASAGALYGSRAANGVIVITTKDGASGEPELTYKVTQSFDRVSERYPMQNIFGQGRNGVFNASRAESWGDYIPDRAGGEDVFETSEDRFIARDGDVYYPILTKNSRETFVDQNWDDAFQTGGYTQHDLSISAGNERSTYFVSLSRLDQQGIIEESYYDRTNIRFNNEFFATDWLTVNTKAFYTNSNSNRIQQSSNTAGLMLGLLRTPPDFSNRDYLGTYVDEDGERFELRHRSYRRDLGDRVNPIYNNPNWTVQEQDATTGVNRFTVTPQLDIAPNNWLNFILRGGVDISTDNRVYFFPIGSGGDRSPGVLAEDGIERSEYNFDAIGKSFFNPTEAISVTSTLGFSINDRNYYRRSGNITGFLVNSRKPTTSLNSANENSVFDDFKTRRRSNRGYGILGVDVSDELFINLSGGLEASSTIDGRFFYPAVDGAWTFTSRFLDDQDVLSFGKVRASWGKVGVQPSPHRFTTPAETGFSYTSYSDPLEISLFGGGFRIDDDLGNRDLNPEIKTEWEVGSDLRFFNDRLEYSVTYYQNNVDDILLFANLTPSTGFDTQYGNFGALENKGIEMDFSWIALQEREYSLTLSGNFSKNENEVTKLVGTGSIDLSGGSVSSRAVVGQSLGVLYGTGSLRDDNGDFVLDQNGFPQLSEPKVLGDPNPDWRGGFSLAFDYKNIGINALIEHSQGGEFSPRSLWVLRRFGTTQETANLITLDEDLVNYNGDVITAGTTVRGNIKNFGGGPVLLDESWYRTGIGGGFGDNQAYNFSIKDATYTKLREITLSYTFNSPRFREIFALSSLQVSASGRNLYSWDNIDGIDPETNQTGVGGGLGLEYFTNPQTRSFLFSLSLTY